MTSREQFEYKCRNGLINGGLAKHENGKYASELTDAVWRGWQASREAVEVDFPPPEPDRGTDSQVDISAGFSNRMRTKCIEYIRAAGIKVKGE